MQRADIVVMYPKSIEWCMFCIRGNDSAHIFMVLQHISVLLWTGLDGVCIGWYLQESYTIISNPCLQECIRPCSPFTKRFP